MLNLLDVDQTTGHLVYLRQSPFKEFPAEQLIAKSRDGHFFVLVSKATPTIVTLGTADGTKLEQIQTLDSFPELAGFTGVALSPDGRNAYLASNFVTNGSDQSAPVRLGSIRVFESQQGSRLALGQTFRGENACLDHVAGLFCHPDGQTLLACCPETHQLVVCSRDPKFGYLKLRKILTNGTYGIRCLEGINAVDFSPDGHFVYTVAGYERGNGAIGVFRVLPNGSIELIQQFLYRDPGLEGFFGGHSIVVSPDGHRVYATATLLSTIACFKREPTNGFLRPLGCINNRKNGVSIPYPTGLAVHPNNRFVYVACHYPGSIAVFEDTSRARDVPH